MRFTERQTFRSSKLMAEKIRCVNINNICINVTISEEKNTTNA